jgi:hypothetical protein
MALGRALRAGTGVFVLLVMSAGALAACAGLVGVEDVRLRRDSGTADVFEEEDDGSFDEGGPGEAGPLPVANV